MTLTQKQINITFCLDHDGAEPSGNSVAVANLVRLSILLDEPEYYRKAGKILTVFSDRLAKIPTSIPEMVSSLLMYEDLPTEVIHSFYFTLKKQVIGCINLMLNRANIF